MAYGIIAFLQDQIYLTQFCFIVVGACFAFLWYNAYPAQMFMGDTGSLALGAALGTVAVMTGQWLLLPVIAIVPPGRDPERDSAGCLGALVAALSRRGPPHLSSGALARPLRAWRLE